MYIGSQIRQQSKIARDAIEQLLELLINFGKFEQDDNHIKTLTTTLDVLNDISPSTKEEFKKDGKNEP